MKCLSLLLLVIFFLSISTGNGLLASKKKLCLLQYTKCSKTRDRCCGKCVTTRYGENRCQKL